MSSFTTSVNTESSTKVQLYKIVGFVLLIAYVLVIAVPSIKFQSLEVLQEDQLYKRWTGFALAVYMLIQWTLAIIKSSHRLVKYGESYASFHKWLGALSPIILFVHATSIGYMYTSVFSIAFLSNNALGLLNGEDMKDSPYWYYKGWMIAHVGLSLLVTGLLLYHVFVVFYFK